MSWRDLLLGKPKSRKPVVKLVKCQYDPACLYQGTIPIPIGSEIRWFCQPHAVQFRTDAVANYVRSSAGQQPQVVKVGSYKASEIPGVIKKAVSAGRQPKPTAQDQPQIADLRGITPQQLEAVPFAGNGSDIESYSPPPTGDTVRTQLKYKNTILVAVTIKDTSSGRREAIIVRRIPPHLEKFTIKRLKRSYVVDIERAYLVLGGMRLLIWDMYNPSPILFREVQGPSGLTIEGQLVDSRMLYTIADTSTIEKLVTASSAKPTEFSMIMVIMIVLAGVAGFFFGGSFGPRIGLSTCQTVATVTTTATTHLIPPIISMIKMWLHI